MTYEEHDLLFHDDRQQDMLRELEHGYGAVVQGSQGNGELAIGTDYDQAHIRVDYVASPSDTIAFKRQQIVETIWHMNMAPHADDHIVRVQLEAEDAVLEAAQKIKAEGQYAGGVSIRALNLFFESIEEETVRADKDSTQHEPVTADEVLGNVLPMFASQALVEQVADEQNPLTSTQALARLALVAA